MSIKLYSWGAAEEVTGSKHFLDINGKIIMIDCGAFQGHRDEADKKNREFQFNPEDIEVSICTHAHFDHCGSYPTLVKKGFKGNIYCTPATRDLMSLVLLDSAFIQAKDIEFLKKKAAKKGEIFDKEVIYTEEDVIKSLNHIITISKERPFYAMDGVKVTLYNAGHILGSSIVYLEINDGNKKINIGFTGDLGRKNLPILKDPDYFPDIDYLVCESTYGNRLHDELGITIGELAEIINETYRKKGKIIIPAFAIERTQELIYYLHVLVDQKKIPDIPIYIDSPMATNATSIFRVHPECFDEDINKIFIDQHKKPFGFDGLNYISSTAESKRLNETKVPMIIISASGMCEAGRVLHHLANNVEDQKNTILIVGFMAEHTLGRKIADRNKEIKIFGDTYKLNASVKILNSFSAHSDYNEIKDYIKHLNTSRLKKVFLVHGEKEAQDNLCTEIKSIGIREVIPIKLDEVYAL